MNFTLSEATSSSSTIYIFDDIYPIQRDLSIQRFESIDFTSKFHRTFDFSGGGGEKGERNDRLSKIKPRKRKERHVISKKNNGRERERGRERASDRDDEGRKIEKNSYLTLDFAFRELILGFRLDRWLVADGITAALIPSIDDTRLSLSLSLDRFCNRAIPRGRGR